MSLITKVYIVGQLNWEGFDIERVFCIKDEAEKCADFLNSQVGAKWYTVEEWELSDGGKFSKYFRFCISDRGSLIESQEVEGYQFINPDETENNRVEPRGKYHCYVYAHEKNRQKALEYAQELARKYFDGRH